jgi:hypothetical protein
MNQVVSTIYSDNARINPDDQTPNGHSTCSASKAAGRLYGVAKNSKLIMAKLGGSIAIRPRSIGTVFGMIASDVLQNGRQKKCIVSLSWSSEPPASGIIPQHWIAATAHMRVLMDDLDCVIVKSAGNERNPDGTNAAISRCPQVFASNSFPLINVGSVDNDGIPSPRSQRGSLLTVWAPANPVVCQSSTENSPVIKSGTSYGKVIFYISTPKETVADLNAAAPQVAGLIATFLSLPANRIPFDISDGQVARNARKFMAAQAHDGGGSWVRSPGDPDSPNVAYNLVTSADNPLS